MWRTVGAIVAGLVAWVVVVTLLNFGLRAAIPGYHAVEQTLQFTIAMKIGRLTEAAITSIVAGAVVSLIAPSKRWAPWLVGLVVLAVFLPFHIQIWSKLPVWYHLVFLAPLVPLVGFGGWLGRMASAREPQAAAVS